MTTIHALSAKTWWQKAIGLIGKKQNKPIFFETRFGIHTIGVRKPIDVIILDEKYTVVKTKRCLKPNRIFLWHPRYKKVIECPVGTVANKKLRLGEEIVLVLG